MVSFGYDSNAPVEEVAGKMLEGIERVRRVEDVSFEFGFDARRHDEGKCGC